MIIVLTGATGTGKSELAIALAKKLDGEIINADAFQVYEEL
ncbi:MAG: tRNA (adenosine(37)-N6)-dimethylallyltransferase MiaA, partial [Bacilli bacterium]|nr:tRNA (adenosine(37)-N6)-dimethylallyltransferase MiaA [Bacilli bacterium]